MKKLFQYLVLLILLTGCVSPTPDESTRLSVQQLKELVSEYNANVFLNEVGVAYWKSWVHNWDVASMQEQELQKDSLYNHYRTLILLRNQSDALSFGQTKPLSFSNSSILATERFSENEKILVIMNLHCQSLPGEYNAEVLANMEVLYRLIETDVSGSDINLDAGITIIARIPKQ